MSRQSADAVVLGAGHNGLVAAPMLADAGWDVVVLEAQSEPGGAVKSAELFPGYVSDLHSAFYPLSVAERRYQVVDTVVPGIGKDILDSPLAQAFQHEVCDVLSQLCSLTRETANGVSMAPPA